MGLLDDAIREHLDLKRRRGADPEEVERAEREALGPARRPPEPADGDNPVAVDEQGAVAEPDLELEEPPEPVLGEPVAEAEERYDAGAEAEYESGVEDRPYESPPPASEAPPARAAMPGPETVEYDVEQEQLEAERRRQEQLEQQDERRKEEQPGEPDESGKKQAGEDVLEETPEFLQDAPEHDRLWFEQRPPKDFDFEG